MHGGRGINLPKAETKKYFTDKKQWQRAVDDINSSKYDDNSDYIGVTGRSTVEINGREWARWSDAQQKGYIELSSMSEQGVAEGFLDQRIADKKKNNPLQASVRQNKYGYTALVTDKNYGKPTYFGGATWQTPELAMGHAKAYIKGYPHLEQEYAQQFIDKNRDGIVQQGVAEGRLNEFAPGGNSASSYYAVTSNFVNDFAQQKQEELQDLIDAGWTKQDLAQAGTLQGQATDIAHLEQVRDGFLKGLKPGFDAYLQGDTQLKDQLGAFWLDNDLPLNQDWESIYGEPWGDDGEFNEGVAEGNYDRDDYYNARQGREYGKDLTATGYGGDGSKTRRDDIFKGQSKRLPADPFARTTGAVPKTGTGRIHSNALPGEMDEANDQKIGGRYDADDFDSMVSRLKKLAGSGPMKTVYDPDRRVYRNMPTAQQPTQQPKKAPR
jgi:hypothetical protein